MATPTTASPLAHPPGPPNSWLAAFRFAAGRNPLAFFAQLKQYGDVAYVAMGAEHMYLVSDPAAIRDVLVTHQRAFKKGRGLERSKQLLGEGLLTSEGEAHLRQRRLLQPAFHKDRIASYATAMTDYAGRISRGWTDGRAVDVAEEMMRLTLGIVGKTLFDADVEAKAKEVGQAMTDVMESFWTIMLPFANIIQRLPLPSIRRSHQARERLDAIMYDMIAERRRLPGDRGDLLSMLLLAQDEEAGGRGMTDTQVRDEAMTLFLAGHETTANALAWTWYLLGEWPEAEAALHEELDRVLGGREPTLADLPALPYVEKVVTESMRLYPPAWIIGRRALVDYRIGQYVLPAGSIVITSPYLVHRDARFFPDPERFEPARWTPAFKASLPPFAYFPFGGGARRCIGESFAWMELALVVATLAQRWRLRLVPGHPVVPQAVVTLRLKHGLKMIPSARTAA
jgi:cytochrome P450